MPSSLDNVAGSKIKGDWPKYVGFHDQIISDGSCNQLFDVRRVEQALACRRLTVDDDGKIGEWPYELNEFSQVYTARRVRRWSCDVFRILDTDRYISEDSSYRENAVLAVVQKMGLYLIGLVRVYLGRT